MTTLDLLNKKAPAFKLTDQDGEIHNLKDYAGKLLVLYFYPKDLTPGCTIEACNFRDNLARVKSAGAAVLGVSADSVQRHAKFAAAMSLNFPVLSDESHEMLNTYGVWQEKRMMGKKYMGIVRTTLIIDEQGTIRKIWTDVKVNGHVDEVIATLKEIK
ncbi:TPA: thioredoxin-dependent thiol peroxidase [Candidatus Uhrbacteria bacterium]|nr:thioredoxin-dependent thiol peroxidase [Candidatus Uhrbacteria bacterium]